MAFHTIPSVEFRRSAFSVQRSALSLKVDFILYQNLQPNQLVCLSSRLAVCALSIYPTPVIFDLNLYLRHKLSQVVLVCGRRKSTTRVRFE